jgi:predicted DNA-binding protein
MRRTLSYLVETMKRTNETGSKRTKQNQIRMTDDLKDRIHEYQKKLHREKGIQVNFSEAVRALIERGLKEAKL